MGEDQGREIHKTAIVSRGAEIGEGVRIGPYAVISDRVTIGEGTLVGPHTVIDGPTVIGKGNQIIGVRTKPVVPGDQLRLEMLLTRARTSLGKLQGTAFVGDQRVAEAEILFSLVDRPDSNE